MDIERVLALIATPLATALVLRMLYLSAGPQQESVGLPLVFHQVTAESLGPDPCDGLPPLLEPGADHRATQVNYFNAEVPRSELRKHIREAAEVYRWRPFCTTADPSLSYGEGMQFLSELRAAAPG